MARYLLAFRPSYGPADCRRALERFPNASVDSLARFRTEVGIAHAKALRQAAAGADRPGGGRGRSAALRAAAAWGGAVEAVNARIRAATMRGIAKDDAAGVYDRPLAPRQKRGDPAAVDQPPVCATEKAPSMDPADEQPAPPEPARRCVPGSMMAHAMGYLQNCGADGATPAQVYEAITLAGWTSPAGKTPKNTLRAALLTAARKGHLRALGGGRYAVVA